jgi:hypothetical protein
MTTQGPQWSPDGQWWWDGQQWRPRAEYQAPAGPQGPGVGAKPVRRPWLWLSVAGALVVLMGVCTVAIATSSKPSTKTSTVTAATSAPTATPTAAPTKPPATAAPAAPARDGSCAPQPCANDNYGWIVTVNHVQYDAPGGSFTQPESGNVFVLVDVTFTNKLSAEQHANPTQFVLLDGAGVKHAWRPMVEGPCTSWEAVNVTQGATFGPKCLSFEATAGKPAGLVLVWTPSFGGGGYNLKLS